MNQDTKTAQTPLLDKKNGHSSETVNPINNSKPSNSKPKDSADYPVEASVRVFSVNRDNMRPNSRRPMFQGNEISTTRYSVLTFLPKNIFEQFSKMANAYFLVMMILQVSVR